MVLIIESLILQRKGVTGEEGKVFQGQLRGGRGARWGTERMIEVETKNIAGRLKKKKKAQEREFQGGIEKQC